MRNLSACQWLQQATDVLPNETRGWRPAEGFERPLSRVFSHRGKQFGAMFVLKCGQNFIKIAIHDRTELVKRQIDAVVCDAAAGEL